MKKNEFGYEHWTDELATYLDELSKHPHYEYPRDEEGKPTSYTPTPESKIAVEAWREKVKNLKGALPEGEPSAYYDAQKAWMCRDETAEGEPREGASPSGRYRLVVTSHTTGKGTWNYAKGRVYEGGKLLTEVYRNYGSFPYAWLEDHPKGSYLLCGEDYQGQTLVNLKDGTKKSVVPPEADDGAGFCWVVIHPAPGGLMLAVEGCYWACPYETILVDFSDPDSMDWKVIARSDDEFKGWKEDGTSEIGVRWEEVDLPGHPLHGKKEDDCSMEELGVVEAEAARRELGRGPQGEEPGWVEKWETKTWDATSATP